MLAGEDCVFDDIATTRYVHEAVQAVLPLNEERVSCDVAARCGP